MSGLKELCVEIDMVLTEYFAVYQDLLTQQYQLNTLLKDGFYLMSKARYSMGAKAVGQLQYNENDLEESNMKVETMSKTFTLLTDDNKKTSFGDHQEGLRRRAIEEIQQSIEDITLDKNDSKKEKDKSKKNPLNWFGILVPQSLRQCQSKFKLACSLSCSIATLKLRYVELQTEYRNLLKKKCSLLDESFEEDYAEQSST